MGWKVLLERLRAPGATTGQVPTYDATTKRFTMATPGGGGTFSVKTVTANQSATNDTLANLTDLACAIGSSETFVYRYCLKVDIGDGIQVAATAPAGATIEMAAVGLCDAGGSEYPALQASDGSAITFTGANGFTLQSTGRIWIDLVVINGATAGTVNFQWADAAPGAGSHASVKARSSGIGFKQ